MESIQNENVSQSDGCQLCIYDSENEVKEVSFLFKIKQFSTLEVEGMMISHRLYFRNLPWQVAVMPRTAHHQEQNATARTLGVFLNCNRKSKSSSWSCYAEAKLSLLSVRPDVNKFSRTIQHRFHLKQNDWGYANFIWWDDILNVENGYIMDDTITFEVHVTAHKPTGLACLKPEQVDRLQTQYKRYCIALKMMYKQMTALTSLNDNLKTNKQQLSAELEKANIELEKQKGMVTELEMNQKKLYKILVDKNIRELETAALEDSGAARVGPTASNKNTECNFTLESVQEANKATISALERNIANLEEQLEIEGMERVAQQKQIRNLEKLVMQLQEEHRDREQESVKSRKRQLNEEQDGISPEKVQKRDV